MKVLQPKSCSVLVVLIATLACSNGPNHLGLGPALFSSAYGVIHADTVYVSAAPLDSTSHSNTGILLTARYSDTKLGRLQLEACVQMGIGEAREPAATSILTSCIDCKDKCYNSKINPCAMRVT